MYKKDSNAERNTSMVRAFTSQLESTSLFLDLRVSESLNVCNLDIYCSFARFLALKGKLCPSNSPLKTDS